MMRLKVYSSLVLLIISSLGLQAKTLNTLLGLVVDAETKQPLADAQIFIQETSGIYITDNKGKFEVNGLKDGFYSLTIFSYQYETIYERITLDTDVQLTFELNQLSAELSEVVINQKKEEIFALKRLNPVEGTAIYAGKKTEVVLLDNMIGNMATNNARQVYAQVAGLNIYESNDGGLQLSIGGRGLDPNRTSNFNTRQNSYDISADVLGYPESYYTPPVEGLKEIEVVRGAASLQYGTQFGGLINFKMKDPVSNQKVSGITRQTIGSFGLRTSFNSLSGTVGKVGYYTYYNYKQGDGYRPNSDFHSHNYYGHLDYRPSINTKVAVEFTYLSYLAHQAGGLWDEQFRENPKFSNRTRNWFEVNWKLYALKWEQKLTSRSDMSLTLYGLDAERNALGFRGIPGEDSRSPVEEVDAVVNDEYYYPRDLIKGQFGNWGAEARYLTRYDLGDKSSVLLLGAKFYQAKNRSAQGQGSRGSGANFSFDDTPYNGLEDVTGQNYPGQSRFTFPNQNLSFFGENIFNLSETLSITPGFRLEYIRTESDGVFGANDSTDHQVLPRTFILMGLGMSKLLSDDLELYVNVSQNYRSVTFSDIRTVNPTFEIDPHLRDESGMTADVGVRGKLDKALSYDLSAYVMQYNDRIGTVFNAKGNRMRTNVGNALISGIESFVEWNMTHTLGMDANLYKMRWFANYAFTGSEYIKAAGNNIEGKEVEFIPKHNIKTGLNAGYKNLMIGAQYTYLSDQFTDAQNSRPAGTADKRSGIIGEIPAYYVLDLSLSYAYKFLKLESGINNALDRSYYTRRATGYPGPGIIPSDGRGYYITLQAKF